MDIKREPAVLWIGLLSPFALLLTTLFTDLGAGWHVVLTAGIPAVSALITAFLVRSEGLVPALYGAAQAVLACMLAFGLTLSTDQQSAIMVFVGLVLSVVVRDRVLAPVPEHSVV